MSIHRPVTLAVGGAVLLLIGAALLIADHGEQHSVGPSKGKAHIANSWQRMADKGQREARGLDLNSWPFQAAVLPRKGMSAWFKREAKEVLLEPENLGLRFNKARYVAATNRVSLWVVPGRNVLCVFRATRIAAACTSKARAYRSGILLEVYRLNKPGGHPTRFTAIGLMPDGVRSVTVRMGKLRKQLPVIRNAYIAEAPRPITLLHPNS